MPGLERGSPVSQVSRARAVAAFGEKPYITQPFLVVIGADPKHLLDNLSPSARRLLFTEDTEISLNKLERSDDAVSPVFVPRLARLQARDAEEKMEPSYQFCTSSRKASRGSQSV